jgi:hypothetical protein
VRVCSRFGCFMLVHECRIHLLHGEAPCDYLRHN